MYKEVKTMFSFRDFLKKGFLNAVGKMADYQIILNASGYYEKGVLAEEDLVDINAAIEAQYAPVEEPGGENEVEGV
jgi:hypothetical protein